MWQAWRAWTNELMPCAGKYRHLPEMQDYPEENVGLQSPYAAMMHAGQRDKGTIRRHCNMRPNCEAKNLADRHKRADYDAPFPAVFGSVSQ